MDALGTGTPEYCLPYQDFFIAYSEIVAHALHIDCQTLVEVAQDATGAVPDLVAHRHLNALAWVLSPADPTTIWTMLASHAEFDSSAALTEIATHFYKTSESLNLLSQYVKGILDWIHLHPKWQFRVRDALRIASFVSSHHGANKINNQDFSLMIPPNPLPKTPPEVPLQVYKLFKMVDAILEEWVVKQEQVLSAGLCDALVFACSNLLLCLFKANRDIREETLRNELPMNLDLAADESAHALELHWKFRLWVKCIQKGRMEVRVQAVDAMQIHLVRIYEDYIRERADRQYADKDHPIAQMICDFLTANKLVEYLVSVDSHPQLIYQSANIVGFLLISNRYTKRDSDTIWRAVTNSPDQRFIDAVLKMIGGFLNIADIPDLLYLVTKLQESPLQVFDNNLLTYARRLLESLRNKWKHTTGEQVQCAQKMEMPPYHLCIDLIRRSAAEKKLDPQTIKDIHRMAITELKYFLEIGPSDSDRRTIYEECIKDIADQSEYSTGSISAINCLIAKESLTDAMLLAENSELATLVIEEFVNMVHTEPGIDLLSPGLEERLQIRLNLLRFIMGSIPDTINSSAGEKIWNAMVGQQALNDHARALAWAHINSITKMRRGRNSFLDRCINDYLPRLDPHFYVSGSLGFVYEVEAYEVALSNSQYSRDLPSLAPLAARLLWHFSFSAPQEEIGVKAVSKLVSFYLGAPHTYVPSTAPPKLHSEVVEPCVDRLRNARSQLKGYIDGTCSGEDEPMVDVLSKDQVREQHLAFSRSLMIMEEFVRGVRCRPAYDPPISEPSNPSQDLEEEDYQGNALLLPYQAFSGGKNSRICRLRVGDQETLHQLTQRLRSQTSFKDFTLIAGGQKIDLELNKEDSILDLSLHQKGLLIVKKVHGSELPEDIMRDETLRPLEADIMLHVQEFLDILDGEVHLSKQVCGE